MTDLRDAYDVVCMGGAMTGSSAAHFLVGDPEFSGTVLVVEPDWSYERAATTRAQNSIREQFTSPLNIAMSHFGMRFLDEFHDRVQVDGSSPDPNFRGTGYLFLAGDDEHLGRLADEAVTMREHGALVEMLSPAEVAVRYPHLDRRRLAGARAGSLREGSFDGWALFQGIRRRAIHHGAEFVRDRVVDVVVVDGRVDHVVLGSGREVGCGHVIDAAGCRAREVAEMAGLDLPIEPRSRTSFVFDCRTAIEGTVPLTITPEGVHFRREQHQFMCGTVPLDDREVDPDDLDARTEEFEELIWPVLANHVPSFDRVRVVASWGGQYDDNVLDHNLVIGPATTVPNFLFANGLSGHGLQHGPAIGRALSELVIHGRFTTIDLGPFGYGRVERGEPITESAVI